ncbi:MAG: glycosyltransferase 87 family protein [Candidatus Dormibacteria bacterium]
MTLAAVGALAVAGQALLFRAEGTVSRAEGVSFKFIPPRQDIAPIWHAAHALVTGGRAYPWYGDGQLLGYAPPYAVMFAPLGLIPFDLAAALSVLLAAALIVATVTAWSRAPGQRLPWWSIGLLLSYPVLHLVRLGQLQTALGVAALSLAVFAQRRGRSWLVGVALAVGMIRTPNAVPLVGMIVVALAPRPRQLVIVAGVVLAILVPLAMVAQHWDPTWVADWLHNLDIDQQVGLQRTIKGAFGLPGVAVLELVGVGVGVALGWGSRGKPMELDRAALALAAGVLLTHISGPYTACFILPAVCRLGQRVALSSVPIAFAVAPWVVVVLSAGALLGTHPMIAVNLLSLMVPVMVFAVYPLLRKPAGAVAGDYQMLRQA